MVLSAAYLWSHASPSQFLVRPGDSFQLVGLPQLLEHAEFRFRPLDVFPFPVDSAQRIVRLRVGRIQPGRLFEFCDSFLVSFFLFEQLSQAQMGHRKARVDTDGVA